MEVMVLASCHGLLLTFLKKTGCGKFCIFNPLTKKKRIIPHNKENRFTGCGFAFGAKSSSSAAPPGGSNYYYYYNHFNVVCVVPRETAFVFKIFSLETGTWRDSNTILKYPKGLDNTTGAEMAICLRGVVYWLTSYEYIIAFDVVKEESRIIEAPKSVSKRVSASRIIKAKEWLWSFWLGVIGDELNYVVVNPDFEIEFWILHDYYEWKLKRKEVMKNKKNFPRSIILCDGERLFFQADFQGYHVEEVISYVYNIRTGVSRRSAFRWGAWFPCVSTLAEV